MQIEFWQDRWKEGQIGFHQHEVNPYLLQYWHELEKTPGKVFVPLCGKSKDMLWLHAHGHPVLGVEISPIAVEAFFQENDLEPVTSASAGFDKYGASDLELWCGDFFDLHPLDLKGVTAVYDRASFIAMPPDLRQRYAAKMCELLVKGTQVLLVTMEYPQHEMQGPPFSVSQDEVERLYSRCFSIEPVASYDVLAANARFRDRGISAMHERVYLLVRQ
ncbi:MAG: thiopurine S-methyltransferase [Gammaproteobacteria bacterium]|nr:thiopurine S-methyltransferase [Gammaproteobacteria bacterium]